MERKRLGGEIQRGIAACLRAGALAVDGLFLADAVRIDVLIAADVDHIVADRCSLRNREPDMRKEICLLFIVGSIRPCGRACLLAVVGIDALILTENPANVHCVLGDDCLKRLGRVARIRAVEAVGAVEFGIAHFEAVVPEQTVFVRLTVIDLQLQRDAVDARIGRNRDFNRNRPVGFEILLGQGELVCSIAFECKCQFGLCGFICRKNSSARHHGRGCHAAGEDCSD